ncbi:MAG: hypothetical protein P8186_10860, partial [Anaerolineae bacterium]
MEHVLRDATGWLVYLVEFYSHLALTQHLARVCREGGCTLDVRRAAALAALGGPFDELAHGADVRSVHPEPPDGSKPGTLRSGKYSPGSVGLFFWRLRSYRMINNRPRTMGHAFYTFHPLGADMPLFNYPQFVSEIDQRVTAFHLPLAISREEFAADLEEYQAQFGSRPEAKRPSNSRYYGPERGLNVFTQVWSKDGTKLEPASIPPTAMLSMDLSHWDETLVSRLSQRYPAKQVAIDVQLGRLALLNPPQPGTNPPVTDENIMVTYCYGFSTALGGGPYHRQLARLFAPTPLFHIDVAKGTAQATDAAIRTGCVPTLQAALELWEASWGEQENP